MHIGITGPMDIHAIKSVIEKYDSTWPKGMGGAPVNHQIIALLKLGHKVSVYSHSLEIKKNKQFEYHQANLSIYLGHYRKSWIIKTIDFFRVEKKFVTDTINKTKPDIIHAFWEYEWAWGAINTKIPTLVTCEDSPWHILIIEKHIYRFFRLIIGAIVLKKAKHLTTVSPYCANGLKILTNKRISVIPNYEPDFVFTLYNENKILNNGLKIAMINNGFSTRKNVEKGIMAYQLLKQNFPTVELHLYGSGHGNQEAAYNWCVNNNTPTNNIFFHGEIPFKRLMTELATMDLFLHTALEESFGMVLVEAMAMGVPVVAGDKSGGPQWILEDGGGVLVDINNPVKIAEGIKLILSENYLEYSKSARAIALKRFSEDVVVKMYLEEYDKIIKNEQ